MKTAFVKTLTRLAQENPRVILLTADLGFQIFDDFKRRFGPRYVNVGVAEAQMICAAAGLAYVGRKPITYSIASFATARCFEQIKISVAYPGLPVVIVGAGGGYGYSHSGVTHQAVEDFALLSSLPGMTVVAPGSGEEVEKLLPQLLKLAGPSYLRIGRGGEPLYHSEAPIVLGRARMLRDGEKIAVLSTGDMASVVVEALEILKSENIFPIAYQMHTIKPLDIDALGELAKKVNTLIVVEEHLPGGGLFSAVNEWRSFYAYALRLLRLGPPDELALGNLHTHDLRRRLDYDAKSVAEACRLAWKRKGKL